MHPIISSPLDLAKFLLGIILCILFAVVLIGVLAGALLFIVGAAKGYFTRNKKPEAK